MKARLSFATPSLALVLLCGNAVALEDTLLLELPTLVTTAGRTPTNLKDSPVDVTVVGEREMHNHGAQRLGDVLSEQTGLNVVHDQWGAGVQVQGLDPAYTLILMDGEPLVGRESGTLDLDRVMVTGISQVEILKGPASSLYGSEAMGGVINLVTQRPTDPFSASFHVRYGPEPGSAGFGNPVGNYGEATVGGSVGVKRGDAELSLVADRMSSTGYDLDPSERGQTAPRYRNYSVKPKVAYNWGEDSRLTFSGRYLREEQRNDADYVLENSTSSIPARDYQILSDGGVSSNFERTFSPFLSWNLKGYFTRYEKTTDLTAEAGDSALAGTLFGQRFIKAESFVKMQLDHHALIVGAGGAHETVTSNYVAGGEQDAASGFAFAQEDWTPVPKFTLQTSARFDAHTDYESHVSPRMAALYRPWSWLGLRASVGNGFKAPTSQQLYLDFTNAQVGYTVFGATGAQEGLQRLRDQGQIREELQTPAFGALKPENSWSFNLGAEVSAGQKASAKVNVFRNNVTDLIESAPVATKFNEQRVYTYFNLSQIHTQGVETEAAYKPYRWLTLGAGYQFLIAEDDDVLADIANGAILKPRNSGTGFRPVQRVEYGGLFNRSRHTANAKAELDTGKPGFLASLRTIYHGRYGFGDLNNNFILDDESEYAPGYLEVNVTLTQKVTRFASLQAGVNNMLDRHAPAPTPTLPGRLYYAGIQLQYF